MSLGTRVFVAFEIALFLEFHPTYIAGGINFSGTANKLLSERAAYFCPPSSDAETVWETNGRSKQRKSGRQQRKGGPPPLPGWRRTDEPPAYRLQLPLCLPGCPESDALNSQP